MFVEKLDIRTGTYIPELGSVEDVQRSLTVKGYLHTRYSTMFLRLNPPLSGAIPRFHQTCMKVVHVMFPFFVCLSCLSCLQIG